MPPFGGIPPPHFFFSFFGRAVAGRVLGGFLAGSRRVLGEFLANFGRNLGFGLPNLVQKASKIEPDGPQGRLKLIKKQGIFGHGFREAPERASANIFPPIWAPCWLNLGAKNRWFFVLFFGFVFWWVFGGAWLHFGSHFGGFLDVFFGIFLDFAEKTSPHEFIANSSQIEGRAPEKGRKKHPKSE